MNAWFKANYKKPPKRTIDQLLQKRAPTKRNCQRVRLPNPAASTTPYLNDPIRCRRLHSGCCIDSVAKQAVPWHLGAYHAAHTRARVDAHAQLQRSAVGHNHPLGRTHHGLSKAHHLKEYVGSSNRAIKRVIEQARMQAFRQASN